MIGTGFSCNGSGVGWAGAEPEPDSASPSAAPNASCVADAPLPRLGTGKIDRVSLTKQYAGR